MKRSAIKALIDSLSLRERVREELCRNRRDLFPPDPSPGRSGIINQRVVAVIVPVLAAVLAAADAIGAPTVITLREHARVTDAVVRLADIADLGAADEAQRRRLAAVKIAPAPLLGNVKTLRRKDVEQIVARAAGADAYAIEGASAVKIERPVTEYDGARFVETARAYLLARLREQRPDLARIEIVPLGDFPAVRGPAGASRLVPRALGAEILAKRMGVWIDLEVAGVRQRSVPVWLAVSAYRPVVVARRAYRAKEALTLADFTVEERDVAALGGAPLDIGATLNGTRARHALAAGVVRAGDIEAQPPVVAQQEIDVRVIAGPIAIDTRAIAQEEGSVGATIRVRNPSSALTYSARIVDDGKALVAER